MNTMQRTPEWYEARKGKITASSFGQAIGIAPSSRQKLWRVLKGLETVEENDAMRWGTENEPVALADYMRHTRKLECEVEMAGFIVHPRIDWLGASPDLLIEDTFGEGSPGVGEIKCPASQALYDEIPPYYMAQVQGLMEITDRAWCDFICWTPLQTRVWRVWRSAQYWAWMFPLLHQFWSQLQTDKEPARASKPTPFDVSEMVEPPITFMNVNVEASKD